MAINKELLQLTLDTIKANLKHWNQSQWHCGTTHCFAGFVELIHMGISLRTDSLILENDDRFYEHNDDWKTMDTAMNLLGLTDYQAAILFAPDNTLEDLEHHVNVLLNTDVPLFSSMV